MKFAPPTLRLLPSGCIRRQVSNVRSGGVSNSTLPPPRLDYKSISENMLYKSCNAFNRKAALPVGALQSTVRLYAELKTFSSELNQKLALRNATSDLIRRDPSARDVAHQQGKALKTEISRLKSRVATLESELLHTALPIPNDTHSDTPIGSEAATVILSTHGPSPLPASPTRDHVRVAHHFHMLDLDAGSTVTGSSWYFLLNDGALLEHALVNYALSVAIRHGYKPVTTPDVVKIDIAERCGFQPRDPTDNVQQMYHLTSDSARGHPELVLSGTAEIPLAGLFANKVFEESQLPLKVVGVGKAFRAEAGARGADTRGLYRVHQFAKVELFSVGSETCSDGAMEDMRKVQVEILHGLKLPFRVLDMPTEELGASAYRKYDIEAWMPGRGSWGEVTSTSNCTDYQSRRLHIRYRRKPPPPKSNPPTSPSERSYQADSNTSSSSSEKQPLPFAHTLNGTAAAIPRLIVAILENGVRLEGDDIMGLNLPISLRPFWLGTFEETQCNIRNCKCFDWKPESETLAPAHCFSRLTNMASLAKQAVQAFNREKPHSSITDWIEILTSSNYDAEAYDGWLYLLLRLVEITDYLYSIPELVDSINLQAEGTAEASRAIRKKLKHGNPHHQLRALVILKALVENCGPKFQTSFANDRLTDAIKQLSSDPGTDQAVKKRLLSVLASWKHQFQGDPKMRLVASLYDQCRPAHRKSAEYRPPFPIDEFAGLGGRELEKESQRQEKEAKKRAKKEKEAERERMAKEARKPKRKQFNFEQEKPEVLRSIVTASQASSNLVNALMLVNREQEPVEANPRVQECLAAAKTVRKQVVRYIQLVEDEELIGTLLETNERIIQALEMYDKHLIPDTTDTGLEPQLSRAALTDGNGSLSELNKLQEKQRAAVARAQRSGSSRAPSGSSNIHPDLHDLDFSALGSDAKGLPSPLRPTSPDSPLDDQRPGRGSLSDFSDYDSVDEETHNRKTHSRDSASPASGSRKAWGGYKTFSDEDLIGEEAVRRQALLDDSDPFADPEASTSGNV
ncbi:hypothetical protein JB92DRAFT_3101042 [Gautieria morchelliformis]|nr:hypothetical protein JB92DRAFT_3101042 [Gautieria morchelliformis]